MLFIPLPFVVALLLVVMFIVFFRGGDDVRTNRAFLTLIALCALQSVLVGLRWGYGVSEARYVLPVLAACLPPLVYIAFRGLMRVAAESRIAMLANLALSPLLIVIMEFIWPMAIDLALIVIFVGHAIALLLLGRKGPDGLDEAQFASVTSAHRALIIAAIALCVSALFDLLVFFDFEWAHGQNVAALVSNANLFGLLLIGLMAVLAGKSKAPQTAIEPASELSPSAEPSEQDRDIIARVDRLMETQALYRDENLNLSRLARRLGLPSRQISGAINRSLGVNVSQYVNQLRIREACRLLEETEQSVTAIMLSSGFQTKSNFNREFRRVTGMSPVDWREREVWKLVSPNKTVTRQMPDDRLKIVGK
ncbi:helix-turn-helix transcriptional regulator [Agrobacterium tumefaciens]|uniref:AraC family transcriptional regulator n=1 Tax=Agrobacterium tumefaciens TaxID=358 RepID=A0A2L2L7H5_AGRTU|nr:AraC family transcriptional regulator [Agrobacterium tumefaciens]AVH40279.1 AraC family transcriptional regulator [Agrobacterium tumefaciens]NSY94256.1 helix-turn-helix transcriptional regulator [Agrobacterium tumefaciens]NSZ02854.1 helix-turn-helix transcriptional regulator [Agrobacterium tumefaciens]NSZ41056.1 helix-turn-helix transcriptional regulator [Agrobacterium tumefaciens]NTB00807.1 helix-turn-helix transcriptional regulator [Agrobacterium tumefaciens]